MNPVANVPPSVRSAVPFAPPSHSLRRPVRTTVVQSGKANGTAAHSLPCESRCELLLLARGPNLHGITLPVRRDREVDKLALAGRCVSRVGDAPGVGVIRLEGGQVLVELVYGLDLR